MVRSLQIGLIFFAIFVAGIVTGICWAQYRIRVQKNHRLQTMAAPFGPLIVRQVLNQIDLTDDQRRATNKILQESADTLRVLRHEIELSNQRLQDDVAKVLNADQQVKFKAQIEERRIRWQEKLQKARHFIENNSGEGTVPPPAQNPSPPPGVPATGPEQPTPAPAGRGTL
jgi:hypothetical protein